MAFAQQSIKIHGFVKDQSSGEVLIGASVVDLSTRRGTATDNNGHFSLSCSGTEGVEFSFLGYKKKIIPLGGLKDTLLTVGLEPSTTIEEIVVSASSYRSADVSSLSVEQMLSIPSLGAKPDIGKALQFLPGISSQNEGSSLLLVRGGDPGQNLYLFDNIPVIYVNHLGGFMSVFNPDIINHIDVYKGGFPARYGGKLSSIIDITHREGNASEPRGSLSVGVTDLSFSAEGPLKMKNTTFIIAGRKTMIDALMALFTGLSNGNENIGFYGFHDLNGKLTWKPNARNSFSLNFYYGDDYLNYIGKNGGSTGRKSHFANTWGNWLVSAHWKSALSKNMFASTALSYTRYRLRDKRKYSIKDEGIDFLAKTISSVENIGLKTEIKYTPFNNWTIGFGGEAGLSFHLPFYSSGKEKADRAKNRILSSENALFVDNTITFLRYSRLQAGARLVGYVADDGYTNLAIEPRVSANIGITRNHSLTLSYMSVNQHSQLLFTAGGIMNNEVWIPSNKDIAPAFSRQYTAGWIGSFKHGAFTAEALVFYKTMENLTAYKEGFASMMGDTDWRSKVETGGKGISKGIEFMVKKNTGKLTGFMSYTLSNATRQYPGINNGKGFLFDYDRLNQFAISLNYKIKDGLSFSASWTYMTGLPYTPAIGQITVPSLTVDENGNREYYQSLLYGERNSAKMRDYHRLDLGLAYQVINRRGRKAVWNLSIYNAYNRKNPYYYYYNTNSTGEMIPEHLIGDQKLSLYQMSFFPIIPSVSYTLFFGEKTDRTINTGRKKKSFKERFENLYYHD